MKIYNNIPVQSTKHIRLVSRLFVYAKPDHVIIRDVTA